MVLPNEIIAVIVSFVLAELAGFIGFVWKANQLYQRDRDSIWEFLSNLKIEIEDRCNTLVVGLQKEVSAREKSQVECKKEVDGEIQRIKHHLELEKEMNKRSIEELKEQLSDLSDKFDKMQESIEVMNRRIDELFKIIQLIKSEDEPKRTRATKQR